MTILSDLHSMRVNFFFSYICGEYNLIMNKVNTTSFLLFFILAHLFAHSQSNHNEICIAGTNSYRIDTATINQIRTSVSEVLPMEAGHLLRFSDSLLINGQKAYKQDSVVWEGLFLRPGKNGLVFYFATKESEVGFRVELFSARKESLIGRFMHTSDGYYHVLGPVYSDSAIVRVSWKGPDSNAPLRLQHIGVVRNPSSERNFGSSGSCNVNINCPEGLGWQNQKRGIVRILVKQGSALFWCSGSLINNVRQDKTPYVLTANHCGIQSTYDDYLQWAYYFNYESAQCQNPLIEPAYQSITGSQLISASKNSVEVGSDFRLVLLNQAIPESFNAFFNGWNRSESLGSSGVGIHHPSGDIKKISTFNVKPVSTGFGQQNYDPSGKYWRVNWIETISGHGVTEGGSSGSPLFDSNGLITGALTGGNASCTNPTAPDYYGKFSFSWEQNGVEPDQQLRPWLDPDQTGLFQLNGLGEGSDLLMAVFSSDFTELLPGQSIQFSDQSIGNISGYKWYFEGGTPQFSEQSDPGRITYSRFGQFDVSLVVSGDNRKDSLMRKSMIKVLPVVVPNPGSNSFELFTGTVLPKSFKINVLDVTGRELPYSRKDEVSGYIVLSLLTEYKGMLLIVMETDGKRMAVKKVINR